MTRAIALIMMAATCWLPLAALAALADQSTENVEQASPASAVIPAKAGIHLDLDASDAPEPSDASVVTLVDSLSLKLAQQHHQQGRLDDAEAQLSVLAKRGALGAEGRMLLGDIARERGDWAKAEQHFRRALAAAPEHASLYLRLGQALQEQKRSDEADAAFARYVALTSKGTTP